MRRTASRLRLLIVQTGTAPDAVRRRYGDYPEWFRRGLGLSPRRVHNVRVDRDARLPSPREFAAVLVTGSSAMVTERRRWSERTAAWVRGAVDDRVPLLGVCYGHQLLAHALGGAVDYNPLGDEVGTVTVQRTRAGASDAFLGALPQRFSAQATHAQTVVSLPPGAVVLARSAGERCQAVRFSETAWGVQFHPEFGVREMRAFVRDERESLHVAGVDAAALERAVRPCPHARTLLRAFARRYVAG